MDPQDSMETTRIARMAAMAGTGVRVGMNYLKHYGRRAAVSYTHLTLPTNREV